MSEKLTPTQPQETLSTEQELQKLRSYTKSELTYNDYLKVPELLELQVTQSNPTQHDEMLFIVIHQTYELWFKLILQEVGNCAERMKKQQILQARHFLDRCVQIMRVLVQQIHILETMRPVDFLSFRDHLKPASGFQSVQFRELEFAAGLKNPAYLRFFDDRPELKARLEQRLQEPDLRDIFYGMLRDLGLDVPENIDPKHLAETPEDHARLMRVLVHIYRNPLDQMPLYLLTESMVDFDSQLAHWRDHHVRVVSRVIGLKPGTGGSSGVDYLERTTRKQCFPQLWEVRTRLSLNES
ncbi:MAG: tryptophan 2,3-dioxygenase [Myxococcales bacterium]|nr:tryptophan 2,3-dioxygenase [Myxococcales bacterium]